MITGIGHSAYNVRDMDGMLAFYSGKLGFTEMFRLNNDNGDLMLIYVRVSDDTFIEFFPATSEPQEREPRAAGYNHLCLHVDNIEETVEWLRSRDVPIDREITFGKAGAKQAWIRDPEGNRIELMELVPASMQATAIRRMKEL